MTSVGCMKKFVFASLLVSQKDHEKDHEKDPNVPFMSWQKDGQKDGQKDWQKDTVNAPNTYHMPTSQPGIHSIR